MYEDKLHTTTKSQLLDVEQEKLTTIDKIKSSCSKFDGKRFINRLFPFTEWLPKYNLDKFKGDIIAGLTVGIMVIPQAIAFATLAGLPPEYGLYAALTPGITYFLFGTSKDVSMGPTVTMGLFTYRFNATNQPIGASTLAFFVGIILITMSIFRLGFVTKFMPSHVISGFVSAAAIVIATTQMKTLFGYSSKADTFYGKVIDFFKCVKDLNPWDISLGVFSIAFLAFFMIMSRTVLKRPVSDKARLPQRVCLKVLNFLCIARSAIVCVLGTVVAFVFHQYGYTSAFTLAGKLPEGLPSVKIPLQSVTLPTNQTIGTTDFLDGFGASLIVLPLIQFIQNISVAKAFGKMYKYEIDSTQELLALGMGNFIGSFFGGWPVTGSFSRSAVNAMSGTRTPFSGVISCTIVFLAVSFLTPVFFYIPKTALSAMIIMAVVTMVDFSVPKQIWRVNKVDLLPYFITFLGTFYKLELGVMVGAGVALLIMVSREVRPRYELNVPDGAVAHIKMKGNLSYPAVDMFKSKIQKLMKLNPNLKAINIDMYSIQGVDYGVVVGLKNILDDVTAEGIVVEFFNFSRRSIKRAFVKGGVVKGEVADLESLPSSSGIPMDNLDDVQLAEEGSRCSSKRSSPAAEKRLGIDSPFHMQHFTPDDIQITMVPSESNNAAGNEVRVDINNRPNHAVENKALIVDDGHGKHSTNV